MIKWPIDWNPDESWPVSNNQPTLLVGDSRTWGHLNEKLHTHGDVRLYKLVHSMGGPVSRCDTTRSLAEVDAQIKGYFEKNGYRPSGGPGSEWSKVCQWLRTNFQSTLSRHCDTLGLPKKVEFGRTIEGVKRKIADYFDQHGARPTRGVRGWVSTGCWLATQDTTLSRMCDEMGLPELRCRTRSIEEAEVAVLAFFREEGVRPVTKTGVEWVNLNSWLRLRGLSLSKLCDSFDLPVRLDCTRTQETVVTDILTYLNDHGKRPVRRDSPKWTNVNAWLAARGGSLSKLCDSLDLPQRVRPRIAA